MLILIELLDIIGMKGVVYMEIEKKYLVSYIPDSLQKYRKKEISQSYINIDPAIRVRKSDEFYTLTVKGSGKIAREEFELELNKEQYETLLKKSETSSIVKTRYEIPIYGGLIAELDIYHGDLENLQTVEVEFDTLEQADSFIPPEWFADEISSDIRYSNAYLALYGLSNPKFL